MSRLNRNINKLLTENISLIASNVGSGKHEFIINTLYELGIKNDKKILIVNYDGPSDFYISSLLSLISNTNKENIYGYLKPCLISSKKTCKINGELFVDSLEKIKMSNIIMCDALYLNLNVDPIDYILEYDEEKDTDLLIINYFNILIKMSKYSLEEILKKFKKYSCENGIHIVLSYNQSSKKNLKCDNDLDFKDIFKKYVQNILIMSCCQKQDEDNYKKFWFYEVKDNRMSIMKSNQSNYKLYSDLYLDFVLLHIKKKSNQLILFEAIKTDMNFNIKDELKLSLDSRKTISEEDISNFKKIMNHSNRLIGYNIKEYLSIFKNEINDDIYYLDLTDFLKECDDIYKMVENLKEVLPKKNLQDLANFWDYGNISCLNISSIKECV